MASLKVKVVDSEPAETIGAVVPVQDAAEAKASMTLWASVKAAEPEETIGVAVPVQDAAEPRATAVVVKAVEPAKAI